jgi:hypothetical protein
VHVRCQLFKNLSCLIHSLFVWQIDKFNFSIHLLFQLKLSVFIDIIFIVKLCSHFHFEYYYGHENSISKSSKHANVVDENNVFVFRRVHVS